VFRRTRPSDDDVVLFLARQRQAALTYAPVGLSHQSPAGYDVDEHCARIGHGTADLERAKAALDAWGVLRLGWVDVVADAPSPEVGTNVAVVVRHVGFWSLNGCRVVARFPASRDDRRYGFAYGTLEEHAESGEESFTVELDPDDGTVWYRVRAVSRPRAPLARLGYPLSRLLQRRFRLDSAKAMAALSRTPCH
jgi:uncharacterized protein (UPF0548 family)